MNDRSLGNITMPGKTKPKFETHTRTLIPVPQKKRNLDRTKTLFVRNNKLLFLTGLLIIITLWIYFIPPINVFTIAPVIIFITLFILLLTGFNKKLQIFATIFIFLFLTISYSVGFDIISTTILLSFIIVLSTLFKTD
jgi:hypothetical protein